MQLRIQNLLPTYFEESKKSQSDIWGKDLVFSKGELIKIVAPSGSGKTSLIHFLYGMRNTYEGAVTYDNKLIKQFNQEQLASIRAKKISIVFQDLRLFTDQTVEKNLLIKHHLQPFQQENKIKEMTERLGISSKLESQCGQCSYGEQQRIAIIRSLLQPFDFLLLDEPFSHLDNDNAVKAMELILEEAALRNACVLFADLERFNPYPQTRLLKL
ncbi:MAG TPA: ATP-binding cassette domain-containing protein [Chitinophagaceae bacterium]|nr:ATP-binding cassette domain-containing protein [Chitinophagaceae bacterium]